MRQDPELVPRPQRLLLAVTALAGPVFVSTIIYTLHYLYVTPASETDWHQEGGSIQIILWVAYLQVVAALVSFVAVVVPLNFFWSSGVQLKRWYWVVTISLLWFPLLYVVVEHDMRVIRTFFIPWIFLWAEAMAVACSGLYLFLLHRAIRLKNDVLVSHPGIPL